MIFAQNSPYEFVSSVNGRVHRSSDPPFEISQQRRDSRERYRTDHHQIDVAGGSFGGSCNRAVDKGHIDLIVQWFQCSSKCLHHAHGFEENLGKLRKHWAGRVRLEVHAISILPPFKNSRLGQLS